MPSDETSKNTIFNLDTDVLNNAFARGMRELGLGALAAGGAVRSYTDAVRSTADLNPHGDRIPSFSRGEVVVPPGQMQRFMRNGPIQSDAADAMAMSFMGMRVVESPFVEEPAIVGTEHTPEQMERLRQVLDEAIARTFRIPEERLLRPGAVTNNLIGEPAHATARRSLQSETSVAALQVPAKPISDNGGKRRINVRRRK